MIERKGHTIYLVVNGRKHKLGVVYPSKKTFRAFRRRSKHYFKAYNGWGLNRELLEYLSNIGIVWVEIEDRDTGKLYRANIKTIVGRGLTHYNGDEEQKVLPENVWSVVNTRPEMHSLDEYMGG